MKNRGKSKRLHGWDDEKIYFWDEERRKEWCVSDEEDLYTRLVEICRGYFKEKMSELHVIGAGSFLEFVINDHQYQEPVGRVQSLYLKPCSFREYE